MQALDRITAILEVVASADKPPVLSDIARETGLSASSCHRLLGELTDSGLLRREAKTRAFVPGMKLQRLAELVRDSIQESKADVVLRGLVDDWSETFYLLRMNGAIADVPLQRSPSTSSRMLVSRIVWRPYVNHCGAGARTVMAFGTAAERDLILGAASFEQYTEFTKSTIADALAEVEATRERGYAISDQELELGVMSIGVPILLEDGTALGALCTIGPRERLHESLGRGLVSAMQDAAMTMATPDLFEEV